MQHTHIIIIIVCIIIAYSTIFILSPNYFQCSKHTLTFPFSFSPHHPLSTPSSYHPFKRKKKKLQVSPEKESSRRRKKTHSHDKPFQKDKLDAHQCI